jgi:hypothetical protein
MSWQYVTRPSLCSGVKECGTKRAQNFVSQILFQNPKNYSLGDVQGSAIILNVIRWTFLTKSATAAMFT